MTRMKVRNQTADFLIFLKENGGEGANALVQDGTVWLTQKMMAQLFDVSVSAISEHLKNIFREGELEEESVIRNFQIAAADGEPCNIRHCNLDAVIAVGFRVSSRRAAAFRQWAASVLQEVVIKGYVLDSERLEKGKLFDQYYFDELLEEIEEIEEIRISERQAYQKATDLFATAFDYDKRSDIAQRFYSSVTNKLRRVANRRGGGTILTDCFSEDELETLGRLVSMYLDMAELRARQRIPTSMEDWERTLDSFLVFDEMGVLQGPGGLLQRMQNAYRFLSAKLSAFLRCCSGNVCVLEEGFDRSACSEFSESNILEGQLQCGRSFVNS